VQVAEAFLNRPPAECLTAAVGQLTPDDGVFNGPIPDDIDVTEKSSRARLRFEPHPRGVVIAGHVIDGDLGKRKATVLQGGHAQFNAFSERHLIQGFADLQQHRVS
jgi:hypothetical protein